MTKTKTAAAALAEDDPFGVESVSGDDPFGDDFADVFAPPTPEEKLTLLAVALVEDPFATTRMGLCIGSPSSGRRVWSRTPYGLRSLKRTLIGPMGVSASHSIPPRCRKEWPRPDAHFGKFSGSARNA